jgi:hypothetical protein
MYRASTSPLTELGQLHFERPPLMQLLNAQVGELFLWIVVLALLTTVAVLAVLRIRAKTLQKEQALHELMSKFRDLHSQGGLTDAEYRTIKTTLAVRFKEQLKDNDDTP